MELKECTNMPKEEFYQAVKTRMAAKPLGTKAEFIKKYMPEMETKIIEKADAALEGMLILPGTDGKSAFVGNPVKWHYYPDNATGYVWVLNIMPHWEAMTQAYVLTGGAKYAAKVADELQDWIQNCPRPAIAHELATAKNAFDRPNPWRSLEVGLRMSRSWQYMLKHLINDGFISVELFEKYAISVYEHGEVLAEVCPILWPEANHNHYLMENVGLLTLSCMFPEFNKSDEWKKHAITQIERCCEAQITKEGGQREACPHYHNICIEQFSEALILAKEYKLEFSPKFTDLIRKALDYSIHVCRPTGDIVPWGDSDVNRGSILSAIYGYIVCCDINMLRIVRKYVSLNEIIEISGKTIWKITDITPFHEMICRLESEVPAKEPPMVSWFKELKQVAMRTGWHREALSLFFACRTPGVNGHAHMDPMGFDFTALGKPLIVDPGRYTFTEGEARRHFKSAQMHNTLTINNKQPYDYVNRWEYTPQKHGDILAIHQKQGFMAAEAMHLNYEPAIHKRMVVLVDGAFLLIMDRVDDLEPNSTVQIYYHINSETVKIDSEDHCAHTNDSDVNMYIFTSNNLKPQLLEGKISEFIDISRPSVRLKLEDNSAENTRGYISIIIPHKLAGPKPEVKILNKSINKQNLEFTFTYNGIKYQFKWGNNSLEREGLLEN